MALLLQAAFVNQHDGVVVRVSALQLVDLRFISFVESYQKTFKYGIHSFCAWLSAQQGHWGEQAGKFVVVLGKDS